MKLTRKALKKLILKESKNLLLEFQNNNELDIIHASKKIRQLNSAVISLVYDQFGGDIVGSTDPEVTVSDSGLRLAGLYEDILILSNAIFIPNRSTQDRINTCDRAIKKIQDIKSALQDSQRNNYDRPMNARPYGEEG